MNNGDKFSTPVSRLSRLPAIPRSSATTKRDSLAAELERDPQLSSAKRQQRSQVLTSHMAHASLERQLLAAQTAKTELEVKLREKDVLIERLESDRRWLAEREKEERDEKEAERTERADEKRKYDSEIRSLRGSLQSIREQYADLQDEHSELARSTSQLIASQKSEISTLSRQVNLLTSELEEFKHIAEERGQAYDALQEQFDELSLNQDSFIQKDAADENWTIVREELHRQAGYLRTLEATNAKMTSELVMLREKHVSIEVLKEQNRDLEKKARAVEELRTKVVGLEAELDAARKEREEWASRSADLSAPSNTPISVTQSLSNLRLTYARLLEEHGSNVALLRQREAELKDAIQRDAEKENTIEELQAAVKALQAKVGRSEHKAILAEREVSFLQAMVASFNAENSVDHEEDATKVETDASAASRSQQLDSLLADYKLTIQELEQEIKHLGGDPSSLGRGRSLEQLQVELDTERASRLAAEKALQEMEADQEAHLEQIETLEQTLFELRGEIGAGRHVPPGVRILSLKENPAQQWADLSQAAMDRLKGENEALLKRLKELEESGVKGGSAAASEELVPRESYEVVKKEKGELEGELKAKEKRLLRLQQVFQAKSAEFREAIASILGVKLAFYPNGQVRVTSQYDLNAAFVFQPSKAEGDGMKMQLVAQGEGGPEELPQLMRYWVEQEQCIPGFLASVTLQCYEKRKMEEQQGLYAE